MSSFEYHFEQLNPHSCKTYLLGAKNNGKVAIVDPVLDRLDDYLQLLRTRNLILTHIIETHTHADHISGAASLKDQTDAELVMHYKAPAKCVTIRVKESDVLDICGLSGKTIETPGHTQDSISLILADRILTGDALFLDDGGAGRDDLPGGDPAAHWDSLQKFLSLPDHLIVYSAHDYRSRTPSSLQNQKLTNPHLKIKSRDEYVDYLNNLKLGPAEWMKDVLKANYACARDPKAAWIPLDAPACEVKGTMPIGVNEQQIETISPLELRKQLNGTDKPFLLDVREPAELQSELGKIEGAKNIPITELISNIDQLSNLKDKEIVLVCKAGHRATTGAQILKQMGFKKPVVLEGGMIGWRRYDS